MQIRCYNCHKPYGLSKDAVYTALDIMKEQNLAHYNAACPHCAKVNKVSHKDLLRAAPDWGKPAPTEVEVDPDTAV